MMRIDCHVHVNTIHHHSAHTALFEQMDKSGIDKAIVLSYNPNSFVLSGERTETEERLEDVMRYAESGRAFPFYWIDPMEEDAAEQVDIALRYGVSGFKVICNTYYPNDPRPMEVWRHIAQAGSPILFHSGIQWLQGPMSAYSRPVYFEALLDIPKLTFALAHVSWPWVDECLALYGKYCHAKQCGFTSAEMFIDTTPGTPPIYREDTLYKLYHIGYPVEDHVIFGTDCLTDYNNAWTDETIERDNSIFDKLQISGDIREKYYGGNCLRFLGHAADHEATI